MSRFSLMPCRLREDRFVPDKGADLVNMTWRELAEKLAPSNRVEALRTLQYVQRGAYVGLLDRRDGPPSNFCFVAQDRSGNIGEILRRNPAFASRVLEVYQVVEIDHEAGMLEPGVSSGPPRRR